MSTSAVYKSLGTYTVKPWALFRNEGKRSSFDLREYKVVSLMICGVSGRGIMRIALEGPTSEVKPSSEGIAQTSAAFRQPLSAGDVNIEP
jgi:hypothetical protein